MTAHSTPQSRPLPEAGHTTASSRNWIFNVLTSRNEIDRTKAGIIGHGEGGMIAPLVAAHSRDVAWIVVLAGPGLNGEDTLLLQSELILKTAGVEDDQIAKTREFNRQTYALVRQEKDTATLQAKLSDLGENSGMSA